MSQLDLFDDGPTFTGRRPRAVTFRGKLGLPIHRWYRLTPSFSPQLAEDIATHFSLGPRDHVLDPFSGVGTVPLCMKYRGIPASSIEINPYLHFVSTVKTRKYGDLPAIGDCFDHFRRHYQSALGRLPRPEEADAYLREHEQSIPRIHDPLRWWSPANLMQLVCVRELLSGHDAAPRHLDLLRMGVLSVLVPVSNAKHDHVSLTFADAPAPTADLAEILSVKFAQMLDDLTAVGSRPCADTEVYFGNSKQASMVLPSKLGPSAIITSPPYPNRFSYARETRPHLFFFDFVDDARSVGELETEAIGGTWGKATSILAAGVAPANPFVGSLLEPYTKNIDGSGLLMASYVTKYFNDLYQHAAEISNVCHRPCRLAYVIGNSKFFGHPLPSDEILAEIFGHFGFGLDRIDKMRRRQSKSGLYEAVVFMRRSGR